MRPIIIAVALFAAPPLVAQGWIEPPPNQTHAGIAKIRSAVQVRISGRVALVEVEEWFENRGGGLGEGDYLYPLPGEAIFSSFSLFQGDRELRGETMDAETARRIYEEIVRRKRDPALIELVGHGLIRSRIFPINPGERRKIRLRYTQVLERAGDALVLRYAAGTATGGQLRRETPRAPGAAPVTFTVTTDEGDRFHEPFSPTHDVRVERRGPRMTIRPDHELTGDFSLFFPFAEDVVGISIATHRPDGENGYFMLTLSPDEVRGDAVPRDVTAVVDVSGSMSGEKIEQAKAALHQLLGSLDPADRFRLIAFSSRVHAYRRGWSAVDRTALAEARSWVDGLAADGGTNIEGALERAFDAGSPDGRLPLVIFLTDGLPSVGEQNPEAIAARADAARGDRRIFAFGVGYDVNTYLLDRLSDAGRGATQYMAPGEDVEQAVSALVRKVSRPVLSDLVLAELPVEVDEIYPERLPDLFSGDELVVFGRYRARGDRTGDVVVAGRRGRRDERFTTTTAFPASSEAHAYIARLWAARKLGYLSRQVRLHGANEELVSEIKRTALRYGLLSEYTAYFVQEPEAIAAGPGGGRAMPVPLATAPAQSAGQGAVMAAERARAQREVRSRADADAADAALASALADDDVRPVSGRLFRRHQQRWTDEAHHEQLPVVRIAAFSEAYFAVIDRLPELEPFTRAFDDVVIAGERVSIHISGDGAARLSPGELGQLLRDFRGL